MVTHLSFKSCQEHGGQLGEAATALECSKPTAQFIPVAVGDERRLGSHLEWGVQYALLRAVKHKAIVNNAAAALNVGAMMAWERTPGEHWEQKAIDRPDVHAH